ncbi:hypothetical protein LEMLEM_LOCUS21681, partial [Lemmus lemmus]
MGPKDNTFIWLIRCQDAEDTAMGPVWIPSARTISTWDNRYCFPRQNVIPMSAGSSFGERCPLSHKILFSDL